MFQGFFKRRPKGKPKEKKAEIDPAPNIEKKKKPKNNKPNIFFIFLSPKRIKHKFLDKYTEF